MKRRPEALVIGATSDIGRAIARRFAQGGYDLILAGRNERWLQAEVEDIGNCYQCAVQKKILDVLDRTCCREFLEGFIALPDVIICVVGSMPGPASAERDPDLAERVMRTNYIAPATLLQQLSAGMVDRGYGCIIGISSVAGDRGRASNYVYGSAKAGFTAWLSGLRNKLHGTGVSVITVKPGFVNTRMTENMALPPWLTAEPEQVATAVWRALCRSRTVVYVKPVWRWIMLAIRLLPESIFKRTRL